MKNSIWKKALSFALCFMLIISCVPMVSVNVVAADDLTATIDTGATVTLKDTDGDSYYDIGTADELYAFAAIVNGGNNSINAELTADITVNEGVLDKNGNLVEGEYRTWTPIGTSSKRYEGIFDGANFSVSGLWCSEDSVSAAGLFGYLSEKATVKNLGVINSYFYGGYVGAIVAYNSGVISDCYATAICAGVSFVGGVVSENIGTIYSCYFNGTINSNSTYVAGLAGRNGGTIINSYNAGTIISSLTTYAGGLVGVNFGYMTGCYNTGNLHITGDENCCLGGVTGYNYFEIVDSDDIPVISNCYNTGNVNGSNGYIGGVVGINGGSLKCCYNSGETNASGDAYIGGVAGRSEYEITDCYNTSAVIGQTGYIGGLIGYGKDVVSRCYNLGIVSGNSDYVAGLIGYNIAESITSCYYLSGCAENGLNGTNTTGAEEKSVEAFLNGEIAYLLQKDLTEQVWGQNIDNNKVNEEQPVFSEHKVYYGYLRCDDTEKQYTNSSASETAITHTPYNYISNNDGTHNYTCSVCYGSYSESCSGGTATCINVKICSLCFTGYGETDSTNHAEEAIYTINASDASKHDGYYGCCKSAITEEHIDENDDGDCTTASYCSYCNKLLADALQAHSFNSDGFCTVCDSYQPAILSENDGYYEMSNSGQLYWFAKQVNNGNTEINGRLTKDIVVNSNTADMDFTGARVWTPIGTSNKRFAGVFDGGNYAIYGLYYKDATEKYIGLFSFVNGGTVKNVSVKDSFMYGYYYVGGIAGAISDNATIKNCHTTGEVKLRNKYIGGIVGINTDSEVIDCVNSMDITNGTFIGGIAGENNGTITRCSNTGSISTNKNRVGGVVGENNGLIAQCINSGAVNSSVTCAEVGGVAGASNGIIENCYNIGIVTIKETTLVSGVLGKAYDSSSVKNCYYLSGVASGGINKVDALGGATVKTQTQFSCGEVAYLLQSGSTEQAWGQMSNQPGSMPVLDSTGLYKVAMVGETGNYSVSNIGDTNADGTVDINDYQALVNTILADNHEQREAIDYDDIIRYDIDGDGYLDVIDASLMHLLINGFGTVDVYTVGDIDRNGVAFEDESEILLIAEKISAPEKLSTAQKYACDINADGTVDYNDLNALANMYPVCFAGEE